MEKQPFKNLRNSVVLALLAMATFVGSVCMDNTIEQENVSGTSHASAAGDYCDQAGTYSDSSASSTYTGQEADDVINFVNTSTSTELDDCVGIDATEAANLAAGGFTNISGGTKGILEATGISTSESDNDLERLRVCATATTSCGASGGTADQYTVTEGNIDVDITFTTNHKGGTATNCASDSCIDLKALIDGATVSVDFMIYGIRGQQAIIDSLDAALTRGVAVRGIVDIEDNDCSATGSFMYSNTWDLVNTLNTNTAGSVKCENISSGYSYIMHQKFFVIDEDTVWQGTQNVSDSGTGGEYNANTNLIWRDSALAAVYTTQFEEGFVDEKLHNNGTDNTTHVVHTGELESYFSPTDATEQAILDMINGASTTLDLSMFFMTAQSVIDAVVLAKANGVNVRMIIDASGRSCCTNDLYPRLDALCEAGIPMKTEDWGAKNHNKWGVADAAESDAVVIEGSTNWSAAGFDKNDENLLVIRNQTVAGHFTTDFNNKYNDITAAACTFVAVEGNTSSTCTNDNCATACTSGSCCDSTDNDYDGYTDAADFGCFDGTPPMDETVANYGSGACSDGVDNDGDNFVDSADFDCWTDLSLDYENTAAKCADGIDNDGDGYMDNMDWDCTVPLGGSPEMTAEACSDGIDNDLDGYTDANDNSCCLEGFPVLAESACEFTTTSCKDGIDNDGDGYTDGGDYGCNFVTGLTSEAGIATCNDGVDNDGDGDTDADDSDCSNPSEANFCSNPEGTYAKKDGCAFTVQQVQNTLAWVNGATEAELDACVGIDASEAANLAAGAPYDGIGTIKADEDSGDVPGHIDSVVGISDAASDNDLCRLRTCGDANPAATSCSGAIGLGGSGSSKKGTKK